MVAFHSFKARILWSLIPVFAALFVVLGLVDLYQQRQLAEEEVSERGRTMAENLAYSSRLAVLTEDKMLLEAALESVTGSADFAYVWLYGERQTPLVNAGAKNFKANVALSGLSDDQATRLWQNGETLVANFTHGAERFIEYITPIASNQLDTPYELQIGAGAAQPQDSSQTRERTIGAVRLGLSMKRVDAHVASFLQWRGWSLLGFLALSTLAIYFFAGRITRPIKQLTAEARQMTEGKWSNAIPVESRDEVGQLALSFNEMARSLNELYLGLELKVAERTNELRAVNIKLSEASQHKSRFLANVNHELRTPLSSIIGYARLLRRETEGQISTLQQENLDDLLRNAERLLAMIDSLLDFARIEAGKMEVQIEPVRVDELIQGAASTIELMLDKSAVTLVRDVPPALAPLHTDREKLRQIILNLLGNAMKFTERGEIRISAGQENGLFKLAVADSGIGIDQANLSRIFDEFDRGNMSSNGHYQGSGLGLAIVKRLVDLLGGSVAVESEVGKGSKFTVMLPVKEPEAKPMRS